MMNATYFGEITELDSRAVWYSDEEDDDEDDGQTEVVSSPNKLKPVEPLTHETFRSTINLQLQRISSSANMTFATCIVSLSSVGQFKNFRLGERSGMTLLGHFGTFGKAFAHPIHVDGALDNYLLWLMFDSTHPHVTGQTVSYFVEGVRESIHTEFNVNPSKQVLILSQQFASAHKLQYLSNSLESPICLPFNGCKLMPPSIIKNQFESSLFEQLTMALQPAMIICLPDPKICWFDRPRDWPTIPAEIVDQRLNDDSLDGTLIFT